MIDYSIFDYKADSSLSYFADILIYSNYIITDFA